MTSLIKTFDNYAIGLRSAVIGLHTAVEKGNALDVTESSLETTGGLSYLSYYVTWVGQNIIRLEEFFSKSLMPIVSSTSILGYVGMVASAFFLLKDTLSFIRQISFIRIFND